MNLLVGVVDARVHVDQRPFLGCFQETQINLQYLIWVLLKEVVQVMWGSVGSRAKLL